MNVCVRERKSVCAVRMYVCMSEKSVCDNERERKSEREREREREEIIIINNNLREIFALLNYQHPHPYSQQHQNFRLFPPIDLMRVGIRMLYLLILLQEDPKMDC